MRTRQKCVATDTWRSLGCRTTPLEHWSRRKPTVEPRWAKQQTKKLRPKPPKINSFMSGPSLSSKASFLVEIPTSRVRFPNQLVLKSIRTSANSFSFWSLRTRSIRTHRSVNSYSCIFILTVPRRYFCCGSLLLLVHAVRIYPFV